jgi:hypothetical protein
MEFMELIETIRGEEASRERLYRGDGRGVRTLTRRDSPEYKAQFAEALSLYGNALKGSRRAWLTMQEALGTSDFPLLFGDILDRQLLANYQETPQTWTQYVKRATVRDFRSVSRFTMDGSEGVLDQVNEQEEYPASSLTEGRYQYAVKKYGRRIPFSWEAMINDDLDALKDIPARFARACRRSEEKFATELFVDTNGPHASLYTGGNANIVTSNPALSVAGLQTAMTVLAAMRDADGEPILIDAIVLVVPPALRITAKNMLNATQIWLQSEAGATSGQHVNAQNWMAAEVSLVVNPYIPIVAATADGNTSWYLFANPSVGRPALEMGFLRGYEQPQVFMKSPNATRVGGGQVDPMDGDFDTDSMQYKVRHVFGGTRMDPKMTVASEGDGS